MNILFVTGQFASNPKDTVLGGMACAVYKNALGMQRNGHKVRILTIGDNEKKWRYQGLNVISIKARQKIDEDKTLPLLVSILRREYRIETTIKQLNKEEPIDIIQYTGWFGIGLFHMNSIPTVMRISSYTKIQLIHNYPGTKKILLELVEYLAAKRMNYVFAPSKLMAQGITKEIGRKVGVIETPFLFEHIKWDNSILEKNLNKKKYLFFLGRMTIDKGIYVIKGILYKLLEKYQNLYLVFAGSGVEKNGISIEEELFKASKEYRNRLVFLGWLPKNKLYPVINNAELILMPSLADNFPNSCAEAMSLGKIVIGTDGSSLEQFIKNGKNGFLTQIGDPESLYQCVDYALNLNEEQKRKISKKAQLRIEKLDLNFYSKKMEYLYTELIRKKLD